MRKVKIHWPNGSARIEDYDNQAQRGKCYRGRRIALVQVGFYLAELSCWFFGRLCRAELSWCSADCWVDSDATREEAGSWWWADQQVATSERVTDVPCVLHLAQPVIQRPTIWDRAAIWERKHVQSDSFWVKVVVLTKKSNIGCLLYVKLPKNPCSKFLASYWSWSEWKRNKWRSFPPMPGPMPRPPPRVKVSDGNLRKEIEWKKSPEKFRLSWDVGGLKNPERNPRQIITWSIVVCRM